MTPSNTGLVKCILCVNFNKYRLITKSKKKIKILAFGLVIWLAPAMLLAQVFSVTGQVKENYRNMPVAGVHIRVNGSEAEWFTDIAGNFIIRHNKKIKSLSFHADQFRNLEISPQDSGKHPLKILMKTVYGFDYADKSSLEGKRLMTKVLANRLENNPRLKSPFAYVIYDKLVISTDSLTKARRLVNNFLILLGKKPLVPFNGSHNIFTMEAVSQRHYLNDLYQRERIRGLRVSGIKNFAATAPISRLQAFSVYDNYLVINNKEYVSPLAGQAFKRYAFNIVDTAYQGTDTVYIVKFNPLERHYVNSVHGYLHINTNGFAVQMAEAIPVLDNKLNHRFLQQYHYYPGAGWFPDETEGTFAIDNFLNQGMVLFGRHKGYYHNIRFGQPLSRRIFDETVLDYDSLAGIRDTFFWDNNRKEPLSASDSNTFRFYEQVGSIRNIEYLLNFGQRLYEGEVEYKNVNLDLNKVLNFNYYERLRLGIGLHLKNQMNGRLSLGGYTGFGMADNRLKYGFDAEYLLNAKNRLKPGFIYYNDLVEPGSTEYSFEKAMYSGELLRKYQLPRMDLVVKKEVYAKINPIRNLNLRLSLSHSLRIPHYKYSFRDNGLSNLQVIEGQAAFHYSYGETFARMNQQKLSLGTRFPEAWLQFGTGVCNTSNQSLLFQKAEMKVNYKFRILGTGYTGVQLAGGMVSASLPYQLLYNGKGSYREASVVTYNSFETMRYNEFLSDRYLYLFVAHNFNPIYLAGYPFKPYFTVMQNFGIGSLSHPENHVVNDLAVGAAKGIKTMENAYLESGVFMNDIFVFNLLGLKTGLGLGIFCRYGAYSLPSRSDNIVSKFALGFSL